MDKKFTLCAASLLLISTSILCIAADPPAPTPSLTDFSKPMVLGKDDKEFTIQLPENPTTGYRWFLQGYDPHLVTPQEREYTPPDTKMMGAPGISTWHFLMKDTGLHVPMVTTLKFESRRAWENTPAKQQSLVVLTSGE